MADHQTEDTQIPKLTELKYLENCQKKIYLKFTPIFFGGGCPSVQKIKAWGLFQKQDILSCKQFTISNGPSSLKLHDRTVANM